MNLPRFNSYLTAVCFYSLQRLVLREIVDLAQMKKFEDEGHYLSWLFVKREKER